MANRIFGWRLGLVALGLGLGIAGAGTPCAAGDRSVTIIQGADEPLSPPRNDAPASGPPLPDLAPAAMQNAAGLKVDLVPGPSVTLGSRIVLSVSTQHPGYLVVVDINADGQMLQIFPNMMSLSQTSGKVASANMINPGPAILIPNPKNPLARFVFTADPPRGSGAIVAILSDRPVQIIDLPEIPAGGQSPKALVGLLTKSVLELKIASTDNPGKFTQGDWSFASANYEIR